MLRGENVLEECGLNPSGCSNAQDTRLFYKVYGDLYVKIRAIKSFAVVFSSFYFFISYIINIFLCRSDNLSFSITTLEISLHRMTMKYVQFH